MPRATIFLTPPGGGGAALGCSPNCSPATYSPHDNGHCDSRPSTTVAVGGGRQIVVIRPQKLDLDQLALTSARSVTRAPRAGFEPAAYSLGGSRSIRLSYRGHDPTGYAQETGHEPNPEGVRLHPKTGSPTSGDGCAELFSDGLLVVLC